MYAPFHSSRAVCTPGRCSGAWSLLFYKKGTCLSRGFHQLFTKEWGEGGVCLPLPSPSFLPPIPPTPFPGGEGGELRFSYARGFAPCIPGIKPLAALTEPAKQVPDGGLARLVACQPCLWFTFLPPIPPTPFPGGEGGELRLFHARGSAPCIPATEPVRHLQNLPSRYPAGGLPGWSPANPAFSLLFCPLSPRPPSPAGKGEIFSFLMQGASPLASPGLNPGGTGAGGESRAGGGAAPPCLRDLPEPSPAGGGRAGKYAKGGGWQAAKGENFPP